MVHPSAKVFEDVNSKCPPRNTILQLSTATLTLSSQTPQNFQIPSTTACG